MMVHNKMGRDKSLLQKGGGHACLFNMSGLPLPGDGGGGGLEGPPQRRGTAGC